MVVFSAELDQFRLAWNALCRRARGPSGSTLLLVAPDADGICAARIVEVGLSRGAHGLKDCSLGRLSLSCCVSTSCSTKTSYISFPRWEAMSTSPERSRAVPTLCVPVLPLSLRPHSADVRCFSDPPAL
jgi:hypothetical protein